MAGFSFNVEPIIKYMEVQSTKAVMAATRIAVQNAQRHAPVRKLFRGTTFKTSARGFRTPILRRATAEGEERVGHANSLIPVFRTGSGSSRAFISGDFRRVGENGRLAKIGTGFKAGTIGAASGGPTAFGRLQGTRTEVKGSDKPEELTLFRTVGGKLQKADPSKLAAVSGEDLRSGKRSILTSRGRFEVRSGRANFKSPEDGITRVGGRLRGEIHAEGPETAQGVIWGYVVSATKDPATGRLYPRDQEFGNAHNRPHPFLRPGLHDSRGALKREMRAAIRLGPQ